MKAAVVPAFASPLEIRDLPVPEPGPGQILVRLEASGLCHTDIHAANGDWPVKPKMPLVPGHEGVGTIESIGEGDSPLQVGDRVALPWLGKACGDCRYCVSGLETYCQSPAYMGYTIDGAYAEYALGYASHAVPVPGSVTPLRRRAAHLRRRRFRRGRSSGRGGDAVPANLSCARKGRRYAGCVMVSERKDGMRVLIMGPPGAGKGTQAARISDRYDIPALSIGDAFRAGIAAGTPLGADAERYLLACEHVPYEVTDRIQSALGHAHP